MIKEKDLKNHLGAEPGKEPDAVQPEPETSQDKPEPESPALKRFKSKHSPLDRDDLFADNQVLRALDILISYDIFKKLNNG